MFNLKYRWQIWRITKKINGTKSFYKEAIRKAEKENRHRDVENLIAEAGFEVGMLEDDRHHLICGYWLGITYKLYIPTPPLKDESSWENCQFIDPNAHHLTVEGVNKIRSLIRKEKKERIGMYLLWIGPITGLIGAVAALLAILLTLLSK